MTKPHIKVMNSVSIKPRNNAMNLVEVPARVFGIFMSKDSIRPYAFAPTVRCLADVVRKQKKYQ